MTIGVWAAAIPLALVAAGMLGCAYLFFTLKRENAGLERRLRFEIMALRSELVSLAARVEEEAERTAMFVPPTPARSGLNLSSRSQILRLHRRGDSPEQIAAELGMPRNEVELLLRVHEIMVAAT